MFALVKRFKNGMWMREMPCVNNSCIDTQATHSLFTPLASTPDELLAGLLLASPQPGLKDDLQIIGCSTNREYSGLWPETWRNNIQVFSLCWTSRINTSMAVNKIIKLFIDGLFLSGLFCIYEGFIKVNTVRTKKGIIRLQILCGVQNF